MVPITEDIIKDMIGYLEKYKQEASQTKNKKPISNESDRYMELNKSTLLYKWRSSSRNEIEDTVKPQNKIRPISSSSLDEKDSK